MEFRILGPLEVRRDGVPVRLPPRERTVLAILLLRANSVVTRDELVEELWPGGAPATAKASLQNAISVLRKALGDGVVETTPVGYRVAAGPTDLDALAFERLVRDARELDGSARADGLRRALDLWRGDALPELGIGREHITRLQEERLAALEERIEAELAAGAGDALVADIDSAVRRHPLRERLWGQLMRALYRSGRQAEALAAYRRAHETFVRELGIEPGPGLKDLQLAILMQDPRLVGEHDDGDDALVRAGRLLPTRTHGDRAESLYDYAVALWRIGERARATALLEHARAESARAGDEALAELVAVTLAQHALGRGLIGGLEYRARCEDAVARVSELDAPRTLAKLLVQLGTAQRDLGAFATGAATLERAISIAREVGDAWQEGWSRNMHGITVSWGPAPVDEVVRVCCDHLDALEWGGAGPLGLWVALALAHAQRAEAHDARRFGDRAVEAARAARLRPELAGLQTVYAVALELIAPDDAEALLRSANDLLTVVTEPNAALPWVRALRARHAVRHGRLDEADELLAAARTGLRREHPVDTTTFHLAAGEVAAARGDADAAAAEGRAAVDAARQSDSTDTIASALAFLGAATADADVVAEARVLHEQKGNVAALRRLDEP